MKVIVVRVGTITHPMTQSIIRMLVDKKIEVSICTTKNQVNLYDLFEKKVHVYEIDEDYTKPANIIHKFLRMFVIRKKLWKEIDKIYDDDSILWVGHNITIKHLGYKLLNYRYILHLNELNENIAYWPQIPFCGLSTEKIGNTALAVVVPEYNRAHITKAVWKLNELPFIMPNKPYLSQQINKNTGITASEEAREIIESLKGRKIILYQGVISKERKLDAFISAVGKLGNEYAFVIMSGNISTLENRLPDNCCVINYINAPYHLEVTSHAYIGILSYIPEKTSNSYLNSLYCAPNKIFEYSMFGIPMISNDVPALKYLFDTTRCGICVEDNEESVIQAIKYIDRHYDEYSKKSEEFCNSVDNVAKLTEVLEYVSKKLRQ